MQNIKIYLHQLHTMIDTGRDNGLLATTPLFSFFSFLWSPSSDSGWKDFTIISTVNQCVLLHFFSFDHRKGLSKVPQIKSLVFGFPPLWSLRSLIFAKKLFVLPKYFQAQNSVKGCSIQNIHTFLKLPFLSFFQHKRWATTDLTSQHLAAWSTFMFLPVACSDVPLGCLELSRCDYKAKSSPMPAKQWRWIERVKAVAKSLRKMANLIKTKGSKKEKRKF